MPVVIINNLDPTPGAFGLVRHPSLAGWLYITASHLAARARRMEQRRALREQDYLAMSDLLRPTPEDAHWNELRPILDDALQSLAKTDRELIVLRFFQDRSLAEVGRTFGLVENTARMRVDRALERLRRRLARRGFTSTATLLGGALKGHAIVPAPASLVSTLTPASLATTAAVPGLLPTPGQLARTLEPLLIARNWILSGSIVVLTLAVAPGFQPTPASLTVPVQVAFPPESSSFPDVRPPRTGDAGPGWRWASVEATDYRALVANLRASGAPERLLRDFVALDLQRHYAQRAAALWPTGSPQAYWKKPVIPRRDPEDFRKSTELDRERQAVLRSLFGPNIRPYDAWYLAFGGFDHDAVRLAWLPDEVLDQVSPSSSRAWTRSSRRTTRRELGSAAPTRSNAGWSNASPR